MPQVLLLKVGSVEVGATIGREPVRRVGSRALPLTYWFRAYLLTC